MFRDGECVGSYFDFKLAYHAWFDEQDAKARGTGIPWRSGRGGEPHPLAQKTVKSRAK